MSLTEAEIVQSLTEGQLALEAERHAEAAAAFARARDALPGVTAIALMVANAWRLAGQVVREREALVAAFAHADRSDVDTLHELGTALLNAGAPVEAQACFAESAAQRPRDPAAWSALASATRAAGDPMQAWTHVQRALALQETPAVQLTAAQVRHALGDLPGARQWLQRAERSRPGHGATRLQRAFTSLLGGANREGWSDFEQRPQPGSPNGARDWHGEPLLGHSIVVLADQGIGDHFHFVRYVHELTERGAARVVLACHRSTRSLFAASGFDVVTDDDVPPSDWWVPLLSLPHRLNVDREVFGERVPYLVSAGGRAPALPAVAPGARRIGLTWAGNPAFLGTVLRDLDEALLPELMSWPGIEWVSLQYGADRPAGCEAMHMPPLSGDWLDTAALLATLDGVVSVDTSIAHLAGAMGVPGHVLLPFSPDWRWGLGAAHTPWYPTLTLVRQPSPRDWRGALDQLRTLLTAG